MGRKYKLEVEVSDLGTNEIARRHIVAPETTYYGAPRARVVDQREMDAMLLKDLITLDEHNVLERVAEDARKASARSVIGSYDPRVSKNRDPQAVSEHQSEALRKFVALTRFVQAKAGREGLESLLRLAVDDIRPKKTGPLRLAIKAADLFYFESL